MPVLLIAASCYQAEFQCAPYGEGDCRGPLCGATIYDMHCELEMRPQMGMYSIIKVNYTFPIYSSLKAIVNGQLGQILAALLLLIQKSSEV